MEQRHQTPSLDFVGRMDQILNRPLTVSTVDSYAEHALSEVIELIESAEDAYSHQPTIAQPTHAATEDAALHYYGLDDTAEVLDHLSEKDAELRAIDQRIAAVATSHLVIVPPDMQLSSPNGSSESAESHERPKTQAKLKTVLFLLANEFEVMLDSPDEVMITEGSVDPAMMRQLPYYEVVVPSLNRTILVCDEYGNATYVFDTQKTEQLLQQQNSTEPLCNRTKRELTALIAQQPDCGTALRTNKNFVKNITMALGGYDDGATRPCEAKYLKPNYQSQDQDKTTSALARELGVNIRTVERAYQRVLPSLGDVAMYPWRGHLKPLFTEQQATIIRQDLVERGILTSPPPAEYMTVQDMANAFGVNYASITLQLTQLERMGSPLEGSYYRSPGRRPSQWYSPAQQRIIETRLREHGALRPRAPEGDYQSMAQVCHALNVSPDSIMKTVDIVGIAVEGYQDTPEVKKYSMVFSPEHVRLIHESLVARGFYRTPPEGYMIFSELIEEIPVDHKRIRHAIQQLSNDMPEDFGLALPCRRGKTVCDFYSPHQQAMIRTALGK